MGKSLWKPNRQKNSKEHRGWGDLNYLEKQPVDSCRKQTWPFVHDFVEGLNGAIRMDSLFKCKWTADRIWRKRLFLAGPCCRKICSVYLRGTSLRSNVFTTQYQKSVRVFVIPNKIALGYSQTNMRQCFYNALFLFHRAVLNVLSDSWRVCHLF